MTRRLSSVALSVSAGLRRRVTLATSLALLAWLVSTAPVQAESGAYVPPDNGVAGLMNGTGNNGYGLGALMAQQSVSPSSTASGSSPASSSGKGASSSHVGASVLSGMGGSSSSSSAATAARKAMRAENRKLKAQIVDLNAQLAAVQKRLDGLQGQSSVEPGPLVKLTAERDALKQSLSDSQGQLSSVRSELAALNTRLESSEAGRKAADAARQTAEGNLKDMAVKLQAGKGAADASIGEVTLARAALTQKEADLKKLQDTLKQTQGELTQTQSELTQLRATELSTHKQNASLTAKVAGVTKQLADSQTQLGSVQTQLTDSLAAKNSAEKQLAQVKQDAAATVTKAASDLKAQLAAMTAGHDKAQAAQKDNEQQLLALRQQLTSGDEARTQLEGALKEARAQLAQANDRASKAGRALVVPLDSDTRKEAYVVGQAMAAGLREKLSGYTATGVGLDLIRVQAGLTDGLQEKMKLPRKDMDRYWQSFADRLNKQVAAQVSAGEKLIAAKVKGHKPDLVADGITYVVAKKGKAIKDASAPVTLSLREQLTDGKVISQLPSLTLAPDDDMPAVVRDALPLLGEGAEVTAWAPAKVVYGDRPLPQGVMPFTVLEYHLTGLKAK